MFVDSLQKAVNIQLENTQLENIQLEPFHNAMQELENTQLEPLNSHNTKPLMKGVGNAGIQLDCERKRSFTKFS